MVSAGDLLSDVDIGFEFGADRGVKIVRGIDAAKQMIENVVRTTKGERLRRPSFGSRLEMLLWEPHDRITGARIQNECYDSIGQSLAGIINTIAVNVNLVDDGQTQGYDVEIFFELENEMTEISAEAIAPYSTAFFLPTAA
jgi:phage baseplate assembly protein W